MRDFEFTITRNSTIPEGRAWTPTRIAHILAGSPNGVSDSANCFLHGLIKGWVLSEVIGLADAEEVDRLLPPRPKGEVMEAIPYGPEDVEDPESTSLTDEDIPPMYGFSTGWASKSASTSLD